MITGASRLIAACGAALIATSSAVADTGPDVYRGVADGIVTITTQNMQGSGVVIGRNTVITNCHVLSGAEKAVVHQSVDGAVYNLDADLDKKKEGQDFCFLYVEALDETPPAIPVRLGSVHDLSVGETVYVISTPEGFMKSMSSGLVSQFRDCSIIIGEDEECGEYNEAVIQTDVKISSGSSGGGVFDQTGRLVGIVTLKFVSADGDAEGLAFALPADWLKKPSYYSRFMRRDAIEAAREGNFSIASDLAERIPKTRERVRARSKIAVHQARAGYPEGARSSIIAAVEDAEDISIADDRGKRSRVDAIMTIAEELARIGGLAEAKAMAGRAKEIAREIEDSRDRELKLKRIARIESRLDSIYRRGQRKLIAE